MFKKDRDSLRGSERCTFLGEGDAVASWRGWVKFRGMEDVSSYWSNVFG